jgi:type IV secretion system protein VirB6
MLKFTVLFFLLFCSIEQSFANLDSINEVVKNGNAKTTIAVPTKTSLNHMNSGSSSISLDAKSGEWFLTSIPKNATRRQIKVEGGSFSAAKKQYKVLYRIDPRFHQPQVFIWTKDYTGNYVSDLNIQVNKNGKGATTDDLLAMDKYIARNPTIPILGGEVVTITLSDSLGLSSPSLSGFSASESPDLALFYLSSSKLKNQILYTSAKGFCNYSQVSNDSNAKCADNSYSYEGKNYEIYGSISANIDPGNIPICPDNATGEQDELCLYNNGRGIGINIGNQVAKPIYSPMSPNHDNSKGSFFYRYSMVDTTLSFTNSWQDTYNVENIFQTSPFPQYMEDWYNYLSSNSGNDSLQKFFDSSNPKPVNNFIFSGNYWMDVEVGQGVENDAHQADSINFKYKINSNDSTGVNFSSSTVIDIPDSGDGVWISFDNPQKLRGNISYSYDYYTGWINISGPINDLVQIIKDKLIGNDGKGGVMQVIFTGLASGDLKGASRILLTLYIIIYAIYFLLGAAEITAKELFTKCIKVIFITQLFDQNSWQFFSTNLFDMFLHGIDYLMQHVIGAGSSVDNIFGFVDPLIQTYLNVDLWAIILIQFLSFWDGGFIIGIILTLSIFFYLLAILMVIAYYIVTFVGISIMISLAPVFFCMVLFEYTRPMFEKYLSVLFSYLIQPTILLIFILLIDEIVTNQLLSTLVSCYWGDLFDYSLALDLRNWGIDWNFNINLNDAIGPIPFITYVPFFIADYQSFGGLGQVFANALLLLCLALIVYKAIEYVDQIVGMLATVQIQSNQGSLEQSTDEATSLYHDISAPVRGLMQDPRKTARSASESFKETGANIQDLYNIATVKPREDLEKDSKKSKEGEENGLTNNNLTDDNPEKRTTGPLDLTERNVDLPDENKKLENTDLKETKEEK